MKKIFFLFFSVLLFANNGVDDTSIGIRHSELIDENKLVIDDINWTKEPAGMSQRYERSFENAPPLIPHDLDGLLPITKEYISCLDCHMPEVASDVGSTAIPKSHFMDLRNNKMLDKLSDERYNCTQCHVPQANAKPRIKNNFKADFRYKDSNSSSNLIDVINQGVK